MDGLKGAGSIVVVVALALLPLVVLVLFLMGIHKLTEKSTESFEA